MHITVKKLTFLSSCHQSRKELFVLLNVAPQSSNKWCWSSMSAVSSDSFLPKQGRKKVAKVERSAMVLAFVEKYRALNGGKFPPASYAKKQVGGSYYVIREIVQELQHNHKRNPLEINKDLKFSEENAMLEPFSLIEEYDKQDSFKESVGNSTKVQSLDSITDKEDGKICMQNSEIHSVIKFNNWEDNGMVLDNLLVSSSRAHISSEVADSEAMNHVQVEDHLSSKLGNKTNISPIFSERKEVYRENVTFVPNKKDDERGSKEPLNGNHRQVLGETQFSKKSNIWNSLKSMAASIIINLWKK